MVFSYGLFTSYAHVDKDFVRSVYQAIRQQRPFIEIWLDERDIRPTTRWHAELVAALANAHLLLLVVTPPAIASRYVREEWQYFLKHDKPILPVYWQDAKLPRQLAAIQYLDCRPAALADPPLADAATMAPRYQSRIIDAIWQERERWLLGRFQGVPAPQHPAWVDELVISSDPQAVIVLRKLFEAAMTGPSDDTVNQWYLDGLRRLNNAESQATLHALHQRYDTELTPLLKTYFS